MPSGHISISPPERVLITFVVSSAESEANRKITGARQRIYSNYRIQVTASINISINLILVIAKFSLCWIYGKVSENGG